MIQDIAIEPVTGEFDVGEVEAYLAALPLVARDPHDAHTFIAMYAQELLDDAIAERVAHSDQFPTGSILFDVHSHRIGIHYLSSEVETARHFVAWLRGRYPVRFFDDDYGGEVPDVDANFERLFGEVHPPSVAQYDEHGLEVINDPVGIAKALIDALLSESQGPAWHDQLSKRSTDEVRFDSSLHATRSGDVWRIARDDIGEAMTMSVEQIDQLFAAAVQVRNNYRLRDFPKGLTLDGGRFEIEDELFGSPDRGLYRGRDVKRNVPVLITLGTPQREPVAKLEQRLAYEVPGVAALLHIGPLASAGEARYDGLVEEEPPPGVRATGWPNLGATEAAQRGLAVGKTIAAAHARGLVLGGLRPELVFLDGDRVVGITPRCDLFHASMTKPDHGVALCFPHIYFAPEVLARPQDPATAAADVFALAAMIAFWHTGNHPFTGEYSANVMAIVTRQRTPWRGDAALGAIVESGLKPMPGRASLDGLLTALQDGFVGRVDAP